jgi:hypothetical protein
MLCAPQDASNALELRAAIPASTEFIGTCDRELNGVPYCPNAPEDGPASGRQEGKRYGSRFFCNKCWDEHTKTVQNEHDRRDDSAFHFDDVDQETHLQPHISSSEASSFAVLKSHMGGNSGAPEAKASRSVCAMHELVDSRQADSGLLGCQFSTTSQDLECAERMIAGKAVVTVCSQCIATHGMSDFNLPHLVLSHATGASAAAAAVSDLPDDEDLSPMPEDNDMPEIEEPRSLLAVMQGYAADQAQKKTTCLSAEDIVDLETLKQQEEEFKKAKQRDAALVKSKRLQALLEKAFVLDLERIRKFGCKITDGTV